MMTLIRITGYAAACCAILGALAACSSPPSESDIAQRAGASRLKWQTYQEDLKAQIGAGPVAEWAGTPVTATQGKSVVTITFQLIDPWASRDTAAPLLLRDPQGRVLQNTTASRQDEFVVYEFDCPLAEGASPLPWIELKFPNGEKRIVFDEKGVWVPAGTA